MISLYGALQFMVILPFYQILTGSLNARGGTDYTVLMKDGRSVATDIRMQYLSYNPNGKNICGIYEKDGKDLIGLAGLNLSALDITPLFTLSDTRILYPAISPDNQKIAFIAENKTTGEAVLRVIMREEFGWFPMPFVKLAASSSPVCFCTPDTLMYTAQNGALTAALISKRPKTVIMQPKGIMPIYHAGARLTAFVRGTEIVISGNISDEIKTDGVTALSFSNDGESLLYAQNGRLYRYSLSEKEQHLLLETKQSIVFAAEL